MLYWLFFLMTILPLPDSQWNSELNIEESVSHPRNLLNEVINMRNIDMYVALDFNHIVFKAEKGAIPNGPSAQSYSVKAGDCGDQVARRRSHVRSPGEVSSELALKHDPHMLCDLG